MLALFSLTYQKFHHDAQKSFQKKSRQGACNDIRNLTIRCIIRKAIRERVPVPPHPRSLFGEKAAPDTLWTWRAAANHFPCAVVAVDILIFPHILHCSSQPCKVTNVEHMLLCEDDVSFALQRDLNSLQNRGATDRTVKKPLTGWERNWKSAHVYHTPRKLCFRWIDRDMSQFCRQDGGNGIIKMTINLLRLHVCRASAVLDTTSFWNRLCIIYSDIGYRVSLWARFRGWAASNIGTSATAPP